jgi:predicted O-linked N-acetylglucosamine transferase (SPINDLY family)
VIPERDCIDYTERVIYMPDSYMPQDFAGPRREPPPRASAGLPAGVFVYCCFHSPHKFSPALFEAWMRVLRAVPDSVLWLRATSTVAKQNLERAARTRGVDPARFVYAPKAPTLADYRARLSLADLFLDTHPYNAHTTASDALCAGVPLLTLKGRTFSSRVASSLLHACGLGDLSVETLQAYEGLAIELGRTPSLATELKRRLCAAAATGPLFDTPRYRRHLEAAYCEIWSRHQRGEVPANVWVERIT